MRSATAYQPMSSINGGLGKSGRRMPEVVDVVADAMPEPGGPLVMPRRRSARTSGLHGCYP
jgi:hypothetical protein